MGDKTLIYYLLLPLEFVLFSLTLDIPFVSTCV